MHRRWILLLLVALGLVFASPTEALAAKKKVEWTSIKVRKGGDARRVKKRLNLILHHATKRAKWGKKGGPFKLQARVAKLTWEQTDDVLKVSVTMVARIEGGKGAKSHIRIGGRPKERRKLERQALKIVAGGLVTRLAEISRHMSATREAEGE